MKFNFNIFSVIMTIWCALWTLSSLCTIITGVSLGTLLVNLFCMTCQILCGIFYAKKAKEPFCNFYASIKEKIKKIKDFLLIIRKRKNQ
jgi:hypothetical protein